MPATIGLAQDGGILVFGESNYGSDQHGLVWGYLIVPGEPAQEIDSDGALKWLAVGNAERGDSFLWLHFSLSNTAAERWMRKRLDLPDSFYESLTEKAVSTRLEQEGNALVALINDVGFDSTVDSSSVSSVSISLEPRLLVSARLRPLRSVDRLRAAIRAGQSFRSSAELLAQLLRDQADVLAGIVREATARVDLIEDKVLANELTPSRRELGSLRRVLVRLQRLLAPEPAALFRLLNRPPVWIGGEDLQDLRQAGEEFSAAVADSAALAERVKLLQEEFAALTNEQTSRTLFILTLVTVLALPINLVAGLFGMNVGGIPLAEHRHGFVLIIGLLAVITGVLGYIGLRNRGE
ncbi:MAG: transporter [Steroidobacteraceae bacterium]